MKKNVVGVLQVFLGLALFCLAGRACGQVTQQDLHNFGSTNNDGSQPSRVVQGADGWLYGATSYGGNVGAGILFKLNTDGTGYTILHSFATNDVANGAYPTGDIAMTPDGWLCGTTVYGGATSAGTVYKINSNGSGFVLLHSFTLHDNIAYGATEYPHNLMQGSDGYLYGTIEGASGGFHGAVFKVDTNGNGYLEIHTFGVSAIGDLDTPRAGVVQGSDGALYGTALSGYRAVSSAGGVFKVSTDGTVYQVLYGFGPTNEAAPYPADWPTATLIQGKDGNLYGTTQDGGEYSLGTIFTINTNGFGYTQLYSFTTTGFDTISVYPDALVQGKNGTLYGTTLGGGVNAQGAAYQITTNGTGFDQLFPFADGIGVSGSQPAAGMILGRDGVFYGVTQTGGYLTNGNPSQGTVFSLSLGPAVPQLAAIRSGANIVLKWPTNATGFVLQSTTNVATQAVWPTVSPAPVVVNAQNTVTNIISGTMKFYRLVKP
jgi:uncharacterized repeat protein (TIGR03803 family)